MAIAARFSSTGLSPGTNLSADTGFVRGPGMRWNIVLSCSYKALHVDYTWFNGTIRDFETSLAPNGTISELWHGRITPSTSSVSGDDPTLQTILRLAAVQNSSNSFAQTWATQYSLSVMATIGGVTSERSNSLEQIRTSTLVIKVWIPALVFFALCCLLYMAVGLALTILAVQTASRGDVRDARARLTLFGIVNWAVSASYDGQEGANEFLTKEQNVEEEHGKIGLVRASQDSFSLKVLGNDGYTDGAARWRGHRRWGRADFI